MRVGEVNPLRVERMRLRRALHAPRRLRREQNGEETGWTYNPAMLKRLYLDNFRCFVNFEYKPERTQLLLGANGSGKSSLLQALRMLKEFIEDRHNPFTQSSRTRWLNRPLQVFEIESRLDETTFEYRTEIRYSPDSKIPSVTLERLKVSGELIFELSDGVIRFYSRAGSAPTELKWEANESALHFAQFSNERVRRFVDWLRTVHCFQIDAYEGAMDETADTVRKVPDFELEYIAEWYLNCLQEDLEGVSRFTSALQEVQAGFDSLSFSRERDGVNRLHANFRTASGRKEPFSLRELSDGQRYLISLYMILHFLIAKGHTVFIDEPDNFIALREIQPWLLAAADAVRESQGQLILISHHPETLNQWAHDCGVLFAREQNGQVAPLRRFKTDYDGILQPSEVMARGWENE
jgi:predicted ATPase